MKRSNTATFSNNRPGSLKRAESKEDLEEKSANKRVAALEAEDNEEQQRELREAQGERGKGSRFRGLAKRSSDRGTNLPWYLINPMGNGMAMWDGLTSLALIFTAIATPFEVGFLPAAKLAIEPLFLVNRLIDLIFILDMTKEFFLSFPAHSALNVKPGSATEFETDLRVKQRLTFLESSAPLLLFRLFSSSSLHHDHHHPLLSPTQVIARRYIRGWLTLDVFSIFPSVTAHGLKPA